MELQKTRALPVGSAHIFYAMVLIYGLRFFSAIASRDRAQTPDTYRLQSGTKVLFAYFFF